MNVKQLHADERTNVYPSIATGESLKAVASSWVANTITRVILIARCDPLKTNMATAGRQNFGARRESKTPRDG